MITLPDLEEPGALDAGMLARWDEFLANLKAHEMQHVGNEIEGAQNLQAALIALAPRETCEAIGNAANALLEEGQAGSQRRRR